MGDPFQSHPVILLFDFDGVILNSRGALISMLNAKYDPRNKWDRAHYSDLTGMEMIRLFESGTKPGDLETLKALYINYLPYLPSKRGRWAFLARLGRKARKLEWKYSNFLPQVQETLQFLHGQGYVLGIASNSSQKRIEKWLVRGNIRKYISAFTTRDDRLLYGVKPSAGPILGLLLRLKRQMGWSRVDRTRVFFVGDNVTDIQAAKNAKVNSIAVLSGHGKKERLESLNPDVVLPSIADLPQYLSEILPLCSKVSSVIGEKL